MFFVVPETFLENYFCDVCSKSLSVQPVKVYPNKQIKCGRCAINSDNGVESMLNKISKQAVFKCVNRYDGCRSLLFTDHVVEHEKKCKSKTYCCPECSEMIPSYKMIRHFKENHPINILQKNYFNFNIESLQISKKFLYKSKDNLFIVSIDSDQDQDSIRCNIFLLGNEVDHILKKFRISSGDTVVDTIRNNVVPYSSDSKAHFSMSKLKFNKPSLFVIFDIIFLDSTLETFEITSNNVQENENKNSIKRIERKVIVIDAFDGNPDDLLGDFIQSCYLCSEIFCGSEEEYKKTDYMYEESKLHFICNHCLPYFKFKRETFNADLIGYIFPENYSAFKLFSRYYCQWNCGSYFVNDELLDHELYCEKQPHRACPYYTCAFSGRLFEIKEHFETHSKTNFKITIYFNTSVLTNFQNIDQMMYFWITGHFVCINYNSLFFFPPHAGFCIHRIAPKLVSSTKKVKLLTFFNKDGVICTSKLYKRIKKYKLTHKYSHTDSGYFCYEDLKDHRLCNSEKTVVKICVIKENT